MTGGRVLSIDAASRTLTLDREVTLPETGTATVNLINGSGKPASVAITAHPAPDRIQVSTLPDGVETYGVWGLSLPSLRRRLFRCVSIRGKHGRHVRHHGGAARTGKRSHCG